MLLHPSASPLNFSSGSATLPRCHLQPVTTKNNQKTVRLPVGVWQSGSLGVPSSSPDLSVCCALCLARAQAQALLHVPPHLHRRCFSTNKRSKGSHSAHRLFEMANKLMADELAGTQTLHVTDVEFAVRKLHDSFIAAQVTRIHSSHFSEPIAYVL